MAGLIPDSIGERVAAPDETMPSKKMGAVIVKFPDGTQITVTDGNSDKDTAPEKDPSFDDNLAEDLDAGSLSVITSDLLEGIASDEQSRQGLVANYVKGLDLLGLKIESASVARGRRSTSKVFHPQLLWSIVEFQSMTRAELYPAAGPCKVRIDGNNDTGEEEKRANDLQNDINHYLTVSAPEYYPDSDRMLFYLGYGGTTFKKVYRCPVRQRPVSESVYLPDLIVSQDATDLQTAQRVTHQMEKLTREIKQLTRVGLYRDIELVTPAPNVGPIKQKEREIAGLKPQQDRPQDIPHTIYECYTFLDLSEWGHEEDGQRPGIPCPYRVTIDKDSREILEIRRNWKDDDNLFRRRRMFVKYGLVPGMGFLDYGLVHLLGNSTRALTALWRVAIDTGMFSAFPAGVRLRGARADTNEINPGPGEFAPLDVPADDIRKALMPMPYKELSATFFQLIQHIEQTSSQMWGALKFPAGEGRTNIPVGSMMAMVEQQTQNMAAVHKRLHSAQAEELQLLKALFAENPEDLTRFAKSPARQWETAEEFEDLDLVPASDPNVPAQVHRIMQSTALAVLAQQNPDIYRKLPVHQRILMNIGIADPQSLLVMDGDGQKGPDPKTMAAMGKLALDKEKAQGEIAKVSVEHQGRMQEIAAENANRQADRQSREKIAQTKAAVQVHKTELDTAADVHDTNVSTFGPDQF